jgi:hypothetical protein
MFTVLINTLVLEMFDETVAMFGILSGKKGQTLINRKFAYQSFAFKPEEYSERIFNAT